MPTTSDTPRTDLEIFQVEYTSGLCECVESALARQLERELNQWKAMAEKLAEFYGSKEFPITERECDEINALTAEFNKLKGAK